jgi:hypothetical protein
MAGNKSMRIYEGLRGFWYITFLDKRNVERHLPAKEKLFGKWSPESCLRAQPNGHRGDVYRISAEQQPDPNKVLGEFRKKYPTVEAYLRYINNLHKQQKAECGK